MEDFSSFSFSGVCHILISWKLLLRYCVTKSSSFISRHKT